MNKLWGFIDFDNTLMGTEQYAIPSLIERFNNLYQQVISEPLTMDIFKKHFHGQARETLCHNLSDFFHINVDFKALYEAREWQVMQYYQSLPNGIPMAPHVIEVLQDLNHQGVVLSVVSNNPIQRALAAMRYASNQKGEALAQCFGTRFFEADHIQKPSPEVYLRAMRQVNALPQKSFAIEDSVTGVTAAVKAGLTTFGFTGFSDNPGHLAEELLKAGCQTIFQDWKKFELHN